MHTCVGSKSAYVYMADKMLSFMIFIKFYIRLQLFMYSFISTYSNRIASRFRRYLRFSRGVCILFILAFNDETKKTYSAETLNVTGNHLKQKHEITIFIKMPKFYLS